MLRFGELTAEARRRLAAAAIPQPGREASRLLAFLVGASEVAVFANPQREVEAAVRDAYLALITRRERGEPFAYLTGTREFYGHELRVDDRVLVPRPETEDLVAAVLELGQDISKRGSAPRVLDLCTGSGAVAVSLALARPDWLLVAGDLSLGALALASANVRRLGASVRLFAGDLATPLGLDTFDVVVANPPYIGWCDASSLPRDVRDFEPHLALFAGDDGLAMIERISTAAAVLAPGAFLVLEVGFGQADEVVRRASGQGLERVAVRQDTAGIPRVVVLKRAGREAR